MRNSQSKHKRNPDPFSSSSSPYFLSTPPPPPPPSPPPPWAPRYQTATFPPNPPLPTSSQGKSNDNKSIIPSRSLPPCSDQLEHRQKSAKAEAEGHQVPPRHPSNQQSLSIPHILPHSCLL
ncbi:hypothetical protein CGRA01v4_07984 [Colletotrichum graminicola]|nr:hypothetical protein CGRA01v4_07984 [Colletotrichum graminicola]